MLFLKLMPLICWVTLTNLKVTCAKYAGNFIKGPEGPLSERKGPRAPWYLRHLAKSAIFGPIFSSGPPNGPPLQADWWKVQFLALICQWATKWSHLTGWLLKSAVFGPILSMGHQMVPHRGTMMKSAVFGPISSMGHQMVPHRHTRLKSAVFGPILSMGHQMVPHRHTMLKSAVFGPILSLGHQMVPPTGWLVKSAVFGPILSVGHQMVQHPSSMQYFGPSLQQGHQLVPYTGWMLKSAIFVPTLHLVHQMVYFAGIKCNFWPHFASGLPAEYWKVQDLASLFLLGHQMVYTGWLVKTQIFYPTEEECW